MFCTSPASLLVGDNVQVLGAGGLSIFIACFRPPRPMIYSSASLLPFLAPFFSFPLSSTPGASVRSPARYPSSRGVPGENPPRRTSFSTSLQPSTGAFQPVSLFLLFLLRPWPVCIEFVLIVLFSLGLPLHPAPPSARAPGLSLFSSFRCSSSLSPLPAFNPLLG